jgi:hypothetical protein
LYKSYKQFSEYFDRVRDKAITFEKNIPKDTDPYFFVKKINSISTSNNVVLLNLKLIKKDTGEEGYDVLMTGGYTNIENFFKDLKTDSRFFSTEILNLEQKQSGYNDNKSLTLSAKIYIFYK